MYKFEVGSNYRIKILFDGGEKVISGRYVDSVRPYTERTDIEHVFIDGGIAHNVHEDHIIAVEVLDGLDGAEVDSRRRNFHSWTWFDTVADPGSILDPLEISYKSEAYKFTLKDEDSQVVVFQDQLASLIKSLQDLQSEIEKERDNG